MTYLNREEAARVVGKSLPFIDKLIREAGEHFVVQHGGNGVPYQLDGDKMVAYLAAKALADEEENRRQREKVAQMQMEFLGGQARPGNETGAGLAVEMRVKLLQEEQLRTKILRDRRELVELTRAELAHERRLRLVAEFMKALPDMLGRRLGWDAATVVACAEQVEAMQARLARELMEGRFLDDDGGAGPG